VSTHQLNGLFSSRQLVEMASSVPARVAHIDDKVGTIARGTYADFFLVKPAAKTADPWDAILNGNITGMSSLLPEMDAKLLALLKETVPKATRVAVLWNPNSHGGVLGFKEMQAAAPELKVTLLSIEVRRPDELEAAYAAITAQKADGLLVITDPITFGNRGQIIEFAAKNRLPAMYEVREFVNDGGLMSYGPSLVAMIRRVPFLLDKILKGAKPADIPVEQPTQFEMVVNEKTAKTIGLTIPPPVLVRADAVIR